MDYDDPGIPFPQQPFEVVSRNRRLPDGGERYLSTALFEGLTD